MVHRIVCGLGALVLFGCGQDAVETATLALPTLEVEVFPVESSDYAFGAEIPGTVHSRDRAVIEAKLNAKIEAVKVREGDRVRLGDVLVVLDEKEIRARYNQAHAANDQAQKDLQRYQSLLRQHAVAQRDFDSVQSQAKIAAAALVEAQTVLGYSQITAPFDGVVSRKFVSAGDLATLGKALIELENPEALRFESAVPEGSIAVVRIGDTYRINIPALTTSLTGTVSEISPSADLATRSYLVKLDLPASNELRLGQYGTVVLPEAAEKTLTIPKSALLTRGQLEMVFVVDGDRARMRLVRTGRSQGAAVEILSGLDGGESLIANPVKTLIDGQPIKIRS